MMPGKCNAITKRGAPCQGTAIPGSSWCMSHDPALTEVRREGQVRGGIEKATARRAVKAWALIGSALEDTEIPAVLKSCMVAVRDGEMEPSRANAIAALARTAIQITGELELEQRIAALEAAAAMPGNLRPAGMITPLPPALVRTQRGNR